MKKIDIFSHFSFPKLIKFIEENTGRTHEFSKLFENDKTLFDANARILLMDNLNIDKNVLIPLPELGITPKIEHNSTLSNEASHICNDEMSYIVKKYPDRFIGVALLPTSNLDIMVSEFERAVTKLNLAGGVIGVGPNLKPIDHPDFDKLFAKANELDVPLWIHPARSSNLPDYLDEENKSQYQYFQAFGWLADSTLAMHRIVFSGVFERYPNLHIIIHHYGAMIPFFVKRVDIGIEFFEANAGIKYNTPISAPYSEHYKKFYIDTATQYFNPEALKLVVDFFGINHVLFGSDSPMDASSGVNMIKNADESIELLPISDAQRKQIYFENAERILKLSSKI